MHSTACLSGPHINHHALTYWELPLAPGDARGTCSKKACRIGLNKAFQRAMPTILQGELLSLLKCPSHLRASALASPFAQVVHHLPLLLVTPTHPLNFSSNVTSSRKTSLTTTPSPDGIRSLSAYSLQAPSLTSSFMGPTVCNVTSVISGFLRL